GGRGGVLGGRRRGRGRRGPARRREERGRERAARQGAKGHPPHDAVVSGGAAGSSRAMAPRTDSAMSPRVTRSLVDRAVAIAALLFVVALQVHRLDDSDTWWHLATGRLIATTGAVPRADPFSFTAAGSPWINRPWFFRLGRYGLWNARGPTAAALGVASLFVIAFVCTYRLARRRLPAWAAAALVFIAAEAAVERFTVRPEAATICFLALEILMLDGAIGWGTVVALVLIQIVWANVHALSVLGLVPLGAELGRALAAHWLPLREAWRAASRRSREETRRLAVATAGVALAGAATPFGLGGAAYPLWLLTLIQGTDVLSFTIIEHRATSLAE